MFGFSRNKNSHPKVLASYGLLSNLLFLRDDGDEIVLILTNNRVARLHIVQNRLPEDRVDYSLVFSGEKDVVLKKSSSFSHVEKTKNRLSNYLRRSLKGKNSPIGSSILLFMSGALTTAVVAVLLGQIPRTNNMLASGTSNPFSVQTSQGPVDISRMMEVLRQINSGQSKPNQSNPTLPPTSSLPLPGTAFTPAPDSFVPFVTSDKPVSLDNPSLGNVAKPVVPVTINSSKPNATLQESSTSELNNSQISSQVKPQALPLPASEEKTSSLNSAVSPPTPTTPVADTKSDGVSQQAQLQMIASEVAQNHPITEAMLKGLPPDVAQQLRDAASLQLKVNQVITSIQENKPVSEEVLLSMPPQVAQKMRDLIATNQQLQKSKEDWKRSSESTPGPSTGTGITNRPPSTPNTASSTSLNTSSPTSSTTTSPNESVGPVGKRDSFGILTVPSEDSWASKVHVDIDPPKGGDINSWEDLKKFGINTK